MHQDSGAGKFFRFCVGYVCLVAGFTVTAQTELEPLVTIASPESQLMDSWDRYLEAKRQKDDYSRKTAFSEIQNQRQEASGTAFEQASLLFLDEGYRELDLGDFENARAEFLNAAQLNPFLWPAYDGLARVKLQRDKDYRYYVSLSLKGIRSAFRFENTAFVLDALTWLLVIFVRPLDGFPIGPT